MLVNEYVRYLLTKIVDAKQENRGNNRNGRGFAPKWAQHLTILRTRV